MRERGNGSYAICALGLWLATACSAGERPVNAERARACPGIDKPAEQRPSMCTEEACGDGFSVTLQDRGGWPSGDYRVVIRHDAATTTCRVHMPFKSCDQESIFCEGKGASLSGGGCALPPSEHSLSEILFEGFPRSVEVTISRDGAQLHKQRFEPDYAVERPNGAGCQPVCCWAHGTMDPLAPGR